MLLLFALNAYTCRELFHAGFIRTMGSAEGAYIAMSRWAMENSRDLTWFPLWFSGMPWRHVYQPGFPIAVAALARAFHASPVVGYHALTAVAYCAGPATLFLLCAWFTGSKWYALAVGLLYSAFSPSVVLPLVRHDIGGVFRPRRYQTTVHYGEGPHVAVLALLPVFLVCLDRALSRRDPKYGLLAAGVLAILLLTNWPGALGLLLALAAYLLARLASRTPTPWMALAAMGCLSYALVAPWIPPSTIHTVIVASQYANGAFPFSFTHAFALVALAAGAAATIWFLRRRSVSLFAAFLGFFLILASSPPVVSELTGFALTPQPHRFQLEMEMAMTAAGCYLVWRFLGRRPLWSRRVVAVAVVAFSLVQLVRFRQYALTSFDPPLDIRAMSEFKVADWFRLNMPDQRVFAPGSIAIWMNVFTNTPQVGGCCDQGVDNLEKRIALYTIYTGQNAGERDAAISLLWLKAYGARAVAVSGPRSTEPFKPFVNPRKFEGVLPVLWRDGDDVIYGVPGRNASLAHVLEPAAIVSRAPANGLEAGAVAAYVAALDDPRMPLAGFQWISRHEARIAAGGVQPQQVISVQVSYDRGWHAFVNGRARRVYPDALGLLAIEPECAGECTVQLLYLDGWELRICRIAQMLAFLAVVAILLMKVPSRRFRP